MLSCLTAMLWHDSAQGEYSLVLTNNIGPDESLLEAQYIESIYGNVKGP